VTVTVAVLGPTAPPAAGLGAALRAGPLCRVTWRVVAGEAAGDVVAVDIVVCDDLGSAAAAAQRWPAAGVVALVSPRRGVPATDARVLCLTDGDVGLVAAYVQSVARRRGLLGARTGR
jgi:hypothetical protein